MMAKQTDKPRASIGNLGLVWRHASRYRGHIAAALFFLCLSSAATLAIPYGFKRVIDRGFGSEAAGTAAVGQSFHYLLVIVIVLAAATAFRFYFVSWIGERTIADLRLAVQKNLLTLPPRFFEENRPSEIASRLTADTAILEQVVGSSVSIALRNIATGVGGIIYLFALSPKLAGMLVVGIPLVFGPCDFLRAAHPYAQQVVTGPHRRRRLDGLGNPGRDEDRAGIRPGGARARPLRRRGRQCVRGCKAPNSACARS